MALIGKIREKSVLLVIIIGVALFAFILGDWRKITGNSDERIGYGTAFGEMVDPALYEESSSKFQEQDQQQFQQQQRQYTQQDADASADKAWNYVVETILFEKEYEALGIDVSDNEFDAYLYGTDGFTVLPELAQGFTDSLTGLFNPKLLQKRIEDMETSGDPKVQQQWEDSKKYYTDKRKQEKYFALLNQGLYVTNLEAQEDYKAQKEIKNISYVVRPYSEIDDKDIKVSDEELQKYYDEHKADKKYAIRKSSRDVRYFEVQIAPSRKDSLIFNKEIEKLKTGFAAAPSDSLFVIQNSDIKAFSSTKQATAVPETSDKAQRMQTYPPYMDTIFKKASVGQIVGPYVSRENVVIAKVLGFTPTRMKVRHILLGTNQSKDKKIIDAKQRLADSLVKFITKDNFEEYVKKYSDDKGSVPQGGLIDNFIEADMVPEFSEFSATKPIGTIGTVKTMFGTHIIEVLERDATTYPVLACISKAFKPSMETTDNKESEVYTLLDKLNNKLGYKKTLSEKLDAFDTIVQKAGYFPRTITIEEANPRLQGFASQFAEDKILKLAFSEEAQEGDLVGSPIKDKEKYILAVLSSIKEKGEPTFENVKLAMKRDLIEDKKAARLTNLFLKDKTLPAMAKRANKEVLKAEVTFANPQITGAGYEPEVIGALFSGLKNGQRTLPLRGKIGVYVVRIDKTSKAPTATSFETERTQLLTNLRSNVQGMALNGIKEKADIIDNRRFLKAGVRN